MPKMKTNKSVAKRFKITGTGKVTRRKAGARHLMTCKSSKVKRNLRQGALASAAETKKIKAMMPYA